MKIEFSIPGEPHGKGRPQFSTVNGHITARTPEKTVAYESLVRWEYMRQCGAFHFPDGSALKVIIRAYYNIPRSASKKRQAMMERGCIRPTKKPDCDNIIKSILDSLNKIAYKDDAQVSDVQISKWYAERPRVDVAISEYEYEEEPA